jgi:hypothetical protein
VIPYGLKQAPNGRAPPVLRPLRQNMIVSGYGPFFRLLPDSQGCACLIFFLMQPSGLNGLKERLWDVFLLKRDPYPLVEDLLGSSGVPSYYPRGT